MNADQRDRVRLAVGARALLSGEQMEALGIGPNDANASTGAKLAAMLAEVAENRVRERERSESRRAPLIQDRYQAVLAKALAATVKSDGKQPGAWFAIDTAELHRCYMAGPTATARGTWHEKHPGSRKGLIIIDWRSPADFADRRGVVALPDITARVRGDAAP